MCTFDLTAIKFRCGMKRKILKSKQEGSGEFGKAVGKRS